MIELSWQIERMIGKKQPAKWLHWVLSTSAQGWSQHSNTLCAGWGHPNFPAQQICRGEIWHPFDHCKVLCQFWHIMCKATRMSTSSLGLTITASSFNKDHQQLMRFMPSKSVWTWLMREWSPHDKLIFTLERVLVGSTKKISILNINQMVGTGSCYRKGCFPSFVILGRGKLRWSWRSQLW